MTNLIISVSAAVIPALLLMRWFWKNDRFPEPTRVVWVTFFLGIAIIPPVIVIAQWMAPLVVMIGDVQADPWMAAIAEALFQAAIPEDLTKFCVFFIYCARRTHFNEPMDGIVYGAAASMGFTAFENVLYVLQGGLDVALMRAITAVPFHCANGIIMGYFIALFELSRRDIRGDRKSIRWNQCQVLYLGLAVTIPILLHTFYDFPPMLLDNVFDPSLHWVFAITFATLVLGVFFAYRLFLIARGLQHAKPIASM